MYEMKPEYFTGIDFIDKEHARLFAIADEAYQLLKNEFIPDKYDHIMNLVNELKDYTNIISSMKKSIWKVLGTKGCFPRKLPTKILYRK